MFLPKQHVGYETDGQNQDSEMSSGQGQENGLLEVDSLIEQLSETSKACFYVWVQGALISRRPRNPALRFLLWIFTVALLLLSMASLHAVTDLMKVTYQWQDDLIFAGGGNRPMPSYWSWVSVQLKNMYLCSSNFCSPIRLCNVGRFMVILPMLPFRLHLC